MGTFKWPLRIASMDGQQMREIEATVDTGAAYTTLPGSLLRELGVEPMGSRRFLLADGRRVDMEYWQGLGHDQRRQRSDHRGLRRGRRSGLAGGLHPGGTGPGGGPDLAASRPHPSDHVLGPAPSPRTRRPLSRSTPILRSPPVVLPVAPESAPPLGPGVAPESAVVDPAALPAYLLPVLDHRLNLLGICEFPHTPQCPSHSLPKPSRCPSAPGAASSRATAWGRGIRSMCR